MTDRDPLTAPQYPMRVVVRRTGLNASVLRAWERRYGAVEPGRSEGGQRLYSEVDIRKLALLRELVDQGHAIGQVAGLSEAELRRLLLREQASSQGPGSEAATRAEDHAVEGTESGTRRASEGPTSLGEEDLDDFLEAGLTAVHSMSTEDLERTLHRAALALTPVELIDGLVVPLLNRIGLLWEQGEVGPASEHAASGVFRRFLDWSLEVLRPPPEAGPVLMAGTPAGQHHEFGSLLAAVIAAGEGWCAIPLGPDLPASELADAARRKRAGVVALSALHAPGAETVRDELLALRAELPGDVKILVGGPAAALHQEELASAGVIFLRDLGAFRDEVRALLRTNGDRRK